MEGSRFNAYPRSWHILFCARKGKACTRAEENTARPFGCDPNRLPRRSLPESQTTGGSRESKRWGESLASLQAPLPFAPGLYPCGSWIRAPDSSSLAPFSRKTVEATTKSPTASDISAIGSVVRLEIKPTRGGPIKNPR